jgi:hypothetical protein
VARNWTRAQQRRYREQRREQAARVADRLMGRKKKVDLDVKSFFGGATMQMPFQYQNSKSPYSGSPKHNSIFIGGIST